jgi:8-oxo-dGTP diphosphatase
MEVCAMSGEQKVYRNPTPTVDVIIERADAEDAQILLIRRLNEPVGWALPGGFVDEGELVEDAAQREAKEETGLDVSLTALLYVYSWPGRDARKHTMSTVYVASAQGEPVGMDDAEVARWFRLEELPADLCFDHGEILEDYKLFRVSGERPSPAQMQRRHGASG